MKILYLAVGGWCGVDFVSLSGVRDTYRAGSKQAFHPARKSV